MATTLINSLIAIVGDEHVLDDRNKSAYYRSGFRSGFGDAVAVVFPGTLMEQWLCLRAAVDADAIVIMQAAKTGLTEGSSPSGFDYDRPVVVINVTRIKRIELLDDNRQALVLPGSTLHELEQKLDSVGRAPHSVIGSSNIGATVIGGLANNSGGALCKRGAAFTELSLYARVTESGELELVDELGIDGLGSTPEEILTNLQTAPIDAANVARLDAACSDRGYDTRVRSIDADLPTRYNADPTRLKGVSGSAGKVAAFAARVDTFAKPNRKQVFFLGTNDPGSFADLRKTILCQFANLPEMAEYMNHTAFDCAERYGKDVFLAVKHLGTERLPAGYALKAKAEHTLNRVPGLPSYMPDRFLYWASRLAPKHLPPRILDFRENYTHFLILVMADDGIDEAREHLSNQWARRSDSDYFECDETEQQAAVLHRFATAGAAIRYQTVRHRDTEEVLALDVALRGDDPDYTSGVPDDAAVGLDQMLAYGHFMCHVFHYDYIYKKGTDIAARKELLLAKLDKRGAKYPAEHNVGHLYRAEDSLSEFYAELDPTNTFNPGIGKTSKRRGRTHRCGVPRI